MSSNDNDLTPPPDFALSPTGHGPAALLLVESLIHGLCENKTLSVAEALAVVERAAEVQLEQAEVADGAGAPLWHGHSLLSQIVTSLRAEEIKPPRSPN